MAGSSPIAEEGKKKARIEIIPLIDVIFFLLATFVLFTLSLNKIASLPVDLPVSNPTPSPPDPNDPTIYLQVSDQDNVFWKQGVKSSPELISINEIRLRLGEYKQRLGTDARVLVQGDNGAKFGAAVRALDEVRLAHIDQVSVQTTVQATGK
jgi:biopolymer transport protein ExbD